MQESWRSSRARERKAQHVVPLRAWRRKLRRARARHRRRYPAGRVRLRTAEVPAEQAAIRMHPGAIRGGAFLDVTRRMAPSAGLDLRVTPGGSTRQRELQGSKEQPEQARGGGETRHEGATRPGSESSLVLRGDGTYKLDQPTKTHQQVSSHRTPKPRATLHGYFGDRTCVRRPPSFAAYTIVRTMTRASVRAGARRRAAGVRTR